MKTMTSILQLAAADHPDRVAILGSGCRWTWSEWVDRIARVAAALQDLGVRPDQRYGIMALNSSRQAEAIHAGYWLGATPVPVNFRLAAPEILEVLNDAQCKLVILDPEFEALFDTDALADYRDVLVSLENDKWERFLGGTRAIPATPGDEFDEALLLYTGGTSGRAKGVPLTHRNIVANALQMDQAWPGSHSECALHVAPMFHAADLVMSPFTINCGTHAFLPRFTPELLFEAISEYRVTATLLVPTMILMALESGLADEYDLSSWRHCVYGTAPMSPELIQKFMATFPDVELVQGYGLTETSPILSFLDFNTHRTAIRNEEYEPLKSCGRALPGVDIMLVDDRGFEVPPGEAGELTARGANVFNGYLNMPDENERAFKDEWFYTGDIARLGEDGLYYLLDRKQNLIITGGENVYSNEVENLLYQVPGIAECAVIGVPDERYGETVTAVIVPDEGVALSGDDVRYYCKGRIGSYKIPRKIHFVGELPKSAVGKILKRQLREEYSGI